LDFTILPIQKNTGTVGLIGERKAAPVRTKAGVLLDEFVFGHPQKRSDGSDFLV
jgi:hypothetical protein